MDLNKLIEHYGDIMIPWFCNDGDCEQGVHLALYSFDPETGEKISDSYGEGDWEPIEDEDFWPDEEYRKNAMGEYLNHCIETGTDVLNILIVKTDIIEKQLWEVEFLNWIGNSKHGLKLKGVRRSGKGEWTKELFPHVREYLQIKKGTCSLFKNQKQLLDALNNNEDCFKIRNNGLKFKFYVTVKKPRSEKAIIKDIRKAAKA